jgi:hypothetical protein
MQSDSVSNIKRRAPESAQREKKLRAAHPALL